MIPTDNETMQTEQLIREALTRDCGCPVDTDAEWRRVSGRVGQRHRRHVALWVSSVAAAAAVVVMAVLLFRGSGAGSDMVYTAQNTERKVVVENADGSREAVVSGAELTVSAESGVGKQTVVVPEGKDLKVTLPDGTTVWLNANSRLTYPAEFRGQMREVQLTGEAYFSVTHDAAHPFVVVANNVRTKVLGTEFNVRCDATGGASVTLVEGSVSVESQSGRMTITPGENAAVTTGGIEVSQVDVDDIVCWRDGIELFDDSTLRDILLQVGTWYNMSVVCRNDSLLSRRLRYVYDRHRSVEEAMKTLNDISKVKVRIEKNVIFVD